MISAGSILGCQGCRIWFDHDTKFQQISCQFLLIIDQREAKWIIRDTKLVGNKSSGASLNIQDISVCQKPFGQTDGRAADFETLSHLDFIWKFGTSFVVFHMEHGDDCVRGTLRERFLIYGIYFFHIELPFS